MSRINYLVGCLVLAAGCSVVTTATYRPVFGAGDSPCRQFTISSAADFAIGGIAAAVVVGLAASAPDHSNGPDIGAGLAALGLASVVVVDGVSGVVGLFEHHRCSEVEQAFGDAERAAAGAKDQREQAWKLTKEAEAAARADDCPRVVELADRVEMLDRDMHDTVLARDVAVARCLAAGSGQ